MKVAIVGCGFIGQKRAQFLKGHALVACADFDLKKAEALADKHPHCRAFQNYQDAVSEAELVMIATPHQSLAEVGLYAIKQGKHVLIEKPAARNAKELLPLIKAAAEHKVKVHVGYNHRYHRAFQKARALVDQGVLGELMFIRARYGHGGRIGYDQEWRAQPELSGGGELIDQGVHLIDLARWFLGDFTEVSGYAHTYYWNMPVDDNGFLLLKTAKKQVAFLHASCTEWKNTFSFEIYGKLGKLEITGLGGSYGIERLTHYHMLPEMGPPETTHFEYPMADNSWELEFAEFVKEIKENRPSSASLEDAAAVLSVVGEIYDHYT